MTDNQLFTIIFAQLNAGFAARGMAVGCKQDYQPREHGAETAPTVYVHKLGDFRYGFTKRGVAYNSGLGKFETQDSQVYRTSFQVSALAIQNPATPTAPTASDLCNTAAEIIAGETFLAAIHAVDVGLERITEVRNPYFANEQNRFQASPSFDFVLSHVRQSPLTQVDPVVASEVDIHRV